MHAALAMAVSAIVHVMGDVAGTFGLTNEASVRGRSTPSTTPNPSLDLLDTAGARLTLDDPAWGLALTYSASILEADVELAPAPLVVQSGDLGFTWKQEHLTLAIDEAGSYGQQNSATTGLLPSPAAGGPAGGAQVTSPTQPPVVQVLAAPATIRFAISRSTLTAGDRLGKRERLALSFEYDMQGGVDAASRMVLPFVHGPRAGVLFSQTLSRRDVLDLQVGAQRTNTALGTCSLFVPRSLLAQPSQPCDPASQIGLATSTWRYRLARDTQVSGGAGVAFAQVRYQDQAQLEDAVFPVGTAGIVHALQAERPDATATTLHLDLAAQPFVDFLSGVVDERAQATGAAVVPTRGIVYTGTVGATRSLSSRFIEPITSVQLALGAEYAASPEMGVGVGASYVWQEVANVGEFSIAMLFVDLALRTPKARF